MRVLRARSDQRWPPACEPARGWPVLLGARADSHRDQGLTRMAMDVFPASVTIGSLPVIKNCRVRTNDAFDSRVQVWVNRDNKAEMILDMATAQVPQKYNMWAPQQERNAQLILDDPAAT